LDGIAEQFEFATKDALRSFHHDRSDLRGAREAKNLTALTKLVEPDQWMRAELHALSFARFAADYK